MKPNIISNLRDRSNLRFFIEESHFSHKFFMFEGYFKLKVMVLLFKIEYIIVPFLKTNRCSPWSSRHVLKILRVKYVFGPYKYTIFCFSPSKIFLQPLIPIKFSITTFDPYF